MLNFYSIFSFLILLYGAFSDAFEVPKQFDWNEKYFIQVELKTLEFTPFLYSITVKVKDKNTGNSVYQFQDSGIPLEFVVKQMGSQKLFFYSIHSGGESGGSTTFRYLILHKGQILNNTLEESPGSYEFVDVDKDGKLEIVTQNLQFEWFEVEPECQIIGFFAEYFDSPEYFLPKIFTFENNIFVENTFKFSRYLQQNYIASMEKTLVKDNNSRNYITGFIQYFYASAKLGMTTRAFTFIKEHNKPFQQYSCQSSKTIHTTVFDFIKKYQDKILAYSSHLF